MPQLSRFSVVSNDFKIKKPTSVPIQISPAVGGNTTLDIRSLNGILSLNSNGSYNLTPNITFSANVMVWGAGGGFSTGNGGAGGFSSGLMVFFANVSYNVVIGRAGSSGTGGGGSGQGGGGGGFIAQNGAGGNGATAYSATSPGSFKVGGPSASVFGFGFGGAGTGGGGGGLYGGAASASGGGGGGGYLESRILFTANAITGVNTTPGFSGYPNRYTSGDGGIAPATVAGDGLIVITVL